MEAVTGMSNILLISIFLFVCLFVLFCIMQNLFYVQLTLNVLCLVSFVGCGQFKQLICHVITLKSPDMAVESSEDVEELFSGLHLFLVSAREAESSPTEGIIEETLLKLETYGGILRVILDALQVEGNFPPPFAW